MRINRKHTHYKNDIVVRSTGDFFDKKTGVLKLDDGKTITGNISAWFTNNVRGEVVFNTGMTGYVETLTDPSYSQQIIVFTYPLIGNYGVHYENWESKKIHAKAIVIENLITNWSHPKSKESFEDWLKKQNVPILYNADTRELTQYIRSEGAMIGSLSPENMKLVKKDLKPIFVSIAKPINYNYKASKKVILIDCGAKENIVRSLVNHNIGIRRVPLDYDFSNESYDGIVLSNGPGDPQDYKKTIRIIKNCLKNDKPIFGICLGSQLMALAVGAKTYKLKFGHRGHNQPCMDLKTSRCYITSQNHGYAIDEKTLPPDWKVFFRNLNDSSVEGIYHTKKPFFSVQFHPESAPGPTDTRYLFDKFMELL